MSTPTLQKGKAAEGVDHVSSSSSTSESSSESSSESESSSVESDTDSERPEHLEAFLQKAWEAAKMKSQSTGQEGGLGEEISLSFNTEKDRQLPALLDPGPSLPPPYFKLGSSRTEGSSLICDVDAEGVQRSAPSQPAPVAPPELGKDGKPLTKRERKDRKKATAGPNWFDLPAPAAADLPRLHREVEALRLRNSLDPKRFYRKEEGEGKGIKGLPKHFAIGTIIPTSTPFGTPSSENLTKAQRKRTVVDELVDDAETQRYAKKKFLDLQGVRSERGRGTWARKQAGRRKKW